MTPAALFQALAGVFVTVVVAAILWTLWAFLSERRAWERLPLSRARSKGAGPSLAAQDAAVRAFLVGWKDQGEPNPDALEKALGRLHIEWRQGPYILEPDLLDPDGEPIKMKGRTMSKDHIIVAILQGEKIGDTLFFQQLFQAAHMATTGKFFVNVPEWVGELREQHS